MLPTKYLHVEVLTAIYFVLGIISYISWLFIILTDDNIEMTDFSVRTKVLTYDRCSSLRFGETQNTLILSADTTSVRTLSR